MGNMHATVDKLTKAVAQKAFKKIKAADINLAQVQNEIATLRSDLAAAHLNITQLQSDYAALLNSYNIHSHNYIDVTITDTADGTGTLTETIRTTSAKV